MNCAIPEFIPYPGNYDKAVSKYERKPDIRPWNGWKVMPKSKPGRP